MKAVKLLAAFLFLTVIFESCSSTKQTVIAVWTNKDKVVYGTKKSVFIMVLTASPQYRNELETSLKAAAIDRGLKATTSIEALGPMNVGKEFPADAILNKVKELGYETIFTVANKFICIGRFSGFNNFFLRSIRLAVLYIFSDCCRKQNRFLKYDSKLLPVIDELNFFYLCSININMAFSRIIETVEETHQRRFSRSSCPHNSYPVTCIDME